MKYFFFFLLFLTYVSTSPYLHSKKKRSLILTKELQQIAMDNYKPIIAIISIPHKDSIPSVLSTDIVRFIEEGGARVLPIHYKTPWETVKELLSHVNGVVFQGGGPKFWPQGEVAAHFNLQWRVFQWIMRENQEKNGYFPVLGICLGFQRLLEFSALWHDGKKDFVANSSEDVYKIRDAYFGLNKVDSAFHAANIELTENESILFNYSREIVGNFKVNDTKKLFFFNNKLGMEEMKLLNEKVFNHSWKIVGKTQDFVGKPFVAAVEYEKLPIFGLQIHPEKIQFDSNDHLIQLSDDNHLNYIPSNQEAIIVNSRISINFVAECKKNKNLFDNPKDYEPKLIDNYKAYIHRGGDINSYYGIEEGFMEFKDMQTVFPEVRAEILEGALKKNEKNKLYKL